MNPDGSEYDVATGSYRSWRKNRQPNAGSSAVGTDLNRNWGFHWGCCGGSSGTFSLGDLPRRRPRSRAPETQRVRDFVNSRVVGGVQQIKTNIDFHTYSELVLWPYGYTTANTAPGADRRRAERRSRRSAAAWPRPTATRPSRRSDLYITDGSIDDWLWGEHRHLQLHVRDVPALARTRASTRPTRRSPRQTTRNREAVAAAARGRRLPVRGDRQAGPVLRRRRRR